MTAVWPLPDLLDHLRGLHDIGANEAADRLAAVTALNRYHVARVEELSIALRDQTAQLAAVVAALDQYDICIDERFAASSNRNTKAAEACVSAIAKAVGR